MKIAFVGKFKRLYDEEYIARSFETLGHEVIRIPDHYLPHQMIEMSEGADLLLVTKFYIVEPERVIEAFKGKTASWNFDLYWGYAREDKIGRVPGFKMEHVFTTDGGHQKEWESIGVNHQCVRQGIYQEEAILLEGKPEGIVFVGSPNPLHASRMEMLDYVDTKFGLNWIGQNSTHEARGLDLNRLYANTKIVVGDSVYSPHYWSNRVVETLGRGGFLIHQEVEGLKEEYPHLVTYERENLDDLGVKISYYLAHEDERRKIMQKNFEWVRDNYTMTKKCAELLSKL